MYHERETSKKKAKKVSKMKIFCIVLLLFGLVMTAGCSKKTSQEKTDYVVVEVPTDCEVKQLFQFESVSKNSLSGATDDFGIPSGVYKIGTLENGDTVVWLSDDIMVYVKGKVSDTQIVYYARRLKEEPVSYEEFKKMYEN